MNNKTTCLTAFVAILMIILPACSADKPDHSPITTPNKLIDIEPPDQLLASIQAEKRAMSQIRQLGGRIDQYNDGSTVTLFGANRPTTLKVIQLTTHLRNMVHLDLVNCSYQKSDLAPLKSNPAAAHLFKKPSKKSDS